MPEGPTIVTIQKKLLPFENKKVSESGGYRNPYAEEISGKQLKAVKTYGKYLILQFADFFVTVHFGMFGRFLINEDKKVNPSFTLIFGKDTVNFYVVNVKQYKGKSTDHFDAQLDVLDKKFKPDKVLQMLKDDYADKEIGDVLMDQAVFPGVGNVIRNEILFLSKIHPQSIIKNIPQKKLRELIDNNRDFSEASVPLIEQKIWKSSASVYKKEKFKDKEVQMYVSPRIKRKTYYVEGIQKKY